MLKFFTNAFKGNYSDSIAINSDHVASVYEIPKTAIGVTDLDSLNDKKTYTNIFCVNGSIWQVEEDYLTVVARLNERD